MTQPAPARLAPAALDRILVVRLDNIGDVLMLAPAIRALRAACPLATITLLASPAGAQAAALLPEFDEVVAVRAVWQDADDRLAFDPGREESLIARLRRGRFDAAFIFTSFSQSPFGPAYACYLAGIPIRIGQPSDFGGALLSHRVSPLPSGSHQVERNLHLVEAVGIPVPSRALTVSIPAADTAAATAIVAAAGIDPGRPYFVVAPGASAAARRYPTGRFGAAAEGIVRTTGWPGLVVGATADEDDAGRIAGFDSRSLRSIAGRTSVPQLAAVLAGARLVVCSHSLPLHLADALGVPVVCLFAGTDRPSEWRPRAVPAVLLGQPVACAPCRRFECPIGQPCLDIAPGDVAAAGLALLRADDRSQTARPAMPQLEDRWLSFAS